MRKMSEEETIDDLFNCEGIEGSVGQLHVAVFRG